MSHAPRSYSRSQPTAASFVTICVADVCDESIIELVLCCSGQIGHLALRMALAPRSYSTSHAMRCCVLDNIYTRQ